jgi:hypothetical protein
MNNEEIVYYKKSPDFVTSFNDGVIIGDLNKLIINNSYKIVKYENFKSYKDTYYTDLIYRYEIPTTLYFDIIGSSGKKESALVIKKELFKSYGDSISKLPFYKIMKKKTNEKKLSGGRIKYKKKSKRRSQKKKKRSHKKSKKRRRKQRGGDKEIGGRRKKCKKRSRKK